MLQAEVPGYARGKGISMMMEQPTPGIGGRHRFTWSYGRPPDMTLSPRQVLAREVWDARSVYQQQGLFNTGIRRALLDVISRNKAAWPVFGKP